MSRRASFYQRSRRARMGIRRRGVTLTYWQRVARKKYISEKAIARATYVWKGDVHTALLEALEWVKQAADVTLYDIIEETDELRKDLEQTTPMDPLGPNDPPLHAKDAWKVTVKEANGRVAISVTNTKHYMQFLEERGGVHDSDGNDGGPSPGWISMIFEEYALRLRSLR